MTPRESDGAGMASPNATSGAGRTDVVIREPGPLRPPEGSLLGDSLHAWRRRTRAELGLSLLESALVVGAGHQATAWHPGILAKSIRARVLAGAAGVPLLLVVDHDAYQPASLRLPLASEAPGRLLEERWWHPLPAVQPGCAALSAPAGPPRHLPERLAEMAALPSVAAGALSFHAALTAAAGEPNAAMQTAAAISASASRWMGDPVRVPASRLLATTLGDALLAAMRRDPRACAESFNRALAAAPRAARRLDAGADPELPLWSLDPQGRRRRVRASDVAGAGGASASSAAPAGAASAGATLLPRAFLLSAIARAALCDRFIHGLGAETYERATDAWFRDWLGAELPPIGVVSATMRLPLPRHGGHPVLTPQDRRRAWWDPERLDGTAPAGVKRAALERVESAPRGSRERRQAYRHLQETLSGLRSARREAFVELDARVEEDAARASDAALADDRTWFSLLHEPSSLDGLAAMLATR